MSFTCPECGATSHNPNDERYRYCGRCHKFIPDARPNGDAMIIDGKNYGFNQPICTDDWIQENHEVTEDGGLLVREPARVKESTFESYTAQIENCCKCGRMTTSRIKIRIDPSTVPYPTPEED